MPPNLHHRTWSNWAGKDIYSLSGAKFEWILAITNTIIFLMQYRHVLYGTYTVSEKDCTLFLFFFSRCPVRGEWCKLHWLLLDTPSFDWNTRRSRGHKMLKMAPTKQQKAFCAVEYAKTTSVFTVQRNFRRQFEVDPPDKNSIKRWHTKLMETGCLCEGKSTGHCLCVFHSTKCLLLFGGRHLEHFVPPGTAGISIKTRSI